MKNYIIGGRGRLGRALATEYASSNPNVIDRSIYEGWSKVSAADQVCRYFEQYAGGKSTVFVASGLLDPGAAPEDLMAVNYALPKNIIDAASKIGIKVITFGTVMEGLLQSKNPYVRSKTELSNYVDMKTDSRGLIKHIQLHTLYGISIPSPFMFLGQMLLAIKDDRPFQMTSGRQLREYHHLEDEAVAIRLIADSSISGVIDLSHGMPVSLKSIAWSVFKALGKNHLLRLGALPEPAEENYDRVFQVNKLIAEIKFRDPLTGINAYMKHCFAAVGRE